jgi:glycosyltransferase involved in cell wall biosynthesis
MRIAHFLPHYPGRDGSAAFCRGLSHAMNRQESGSCPILTLRPCLLKQGEHEELLPYRKESGKNPFGLPRELLSDLQSNRHHLDGVVLHGTYNPPMAAMGRHLRRAGIPYLFIPHDPYVEALRRNHRWRKLAYWHLFEKSLIEGAAAVQLLDASHEPPLRSLGCKVRTVVIPNGCETSMLNELPENIRIPGQEKDVRVLYFGRMDCHHKGLDLLLQGFAGAVKKDPNSMRLVTLVMTGNDWTDRKYLEALSIELGIADRVKFTGRRPEGAMKILADSDLVVLPSRFDGFGLCIVEAMLAARPVLVSTGAGVASHVALAGGGLIMAPYASSIERALLAAMARKNEWADLGRKNQSYVRYQLTWDQVAERTLEAYREIFSAT